MGKGILILFRVSWPMIWPMFELFGSRAPGASRIGVKLKPWLYLLTTGTGHTRQVSRQYSSTVRSDENLPLRATLRMDMRAQRLTSR
jgi:hypothetical protein